MGLIVGIDPGVSGALVCMASDGAALAAEPMPLLTGKGRKRINAGLLVWILSDWRERFGGTADGFRFVMVEEVHADPRWGRVACFSFGQGYGTLIGVLTTLRLPFGFVPPSAWRKSVIPGAKPGKDDAIRWCRRTHPLLDVGQYSRAVREGIADAAAIAEYGRRRIYGAKGGSVMGEPLMCQICKASESDAGCSATPSCTPAAPA